ncbi:MAG: HD domain-containing phosphohydrolase [Thermodesulfobacteriota bacterium]
MDRFKQVILHNFERILVVVILVAAFAGTYFVEEKSVVLNFYYLPVLLAGYFLGRRMGILTAIFSILAVVISTLFFPQAYLKERELFSSLAKLSSWGGFLILASIAVGTLYEQKELRLQELKNAYIGVLEILSKYLESTDRYTKGHSVRVSELAMEIAIAMVLSRGEGEILRKAAALSSEEKELLDEHAVKGAYLLSSVGSVLKEVVPIVVSHHNYFMKATDEPEGKELVKVPLGARIVAVADAFDAMTTDRPYRRGMPPWEALEEVQKNAGKQFDPEVVEAFKRVMSEKMEKV